MMRLIPSWTAVTSPELVTVALGELAVHVVVRGASVVPLASRNVTFSCTVAFVARTTVSADNDRLATGARTVTNVDPVFPPVDALIMLEPDATAVTTPAAFTVATVFDADVHVNACPDMTPPSWSFTTALSATVSPTASCGDDGLMVTVVTTRAGGSTTPSPGGVSDEHATSNAIADANCAWRD
jgi:hypothetical protein